MTPLEKLASLPDDETFVKAGTTLTRLQAKAIRLTDHQPPSSSTKPGAPVSIYRRPQRVA